MKKIEQCGDLYLIKHLFTYLIGQPREYIQLDDLPRVDYDTFMDLCRQIFGQSEISKSSIDTLIKLMSERDRFVNPQAPDHLKSDIRGQVKQRLCEIVLRLCQDNMLKLVKQVAGSSSSDNKKQSEVIHLTCAEKIGYCRLAIDQVQSAVGIQDEYMHRPQVNLTENVKQLQECIDTLRYQEKIIMAIQERTKELQQFESKANEKLKPKIKSKIDELRQQKTVLDSLNSKEGHLFDDYVKPLQLFKLMYENVKS